MANLPKSYGNFYGNANFRMALLPVMYGFFYGIFASIIAPCILYRYSSIASIFAILF